MSHVKINVANFIWIQGAVGNYGCHQKKELEFSVSGLERKDSRQAHIIMGISCILNIKDLQFENLLGRHGFLKLYLDSEIDYFVCRETC